MDVSIVWIMHFAHLILSPCWCWKKRNKCEQNQEFDLNAHRLVEIELDACLVLYLS